MELQDSDAGAPPTPPRPTPIPTCGAAGVHDGAQVLRAGGDGCCRGLGTQLHQLSKGVDVVLQILGRLRGRGEGETGGG